MISTPRRALLGAMVAAPLAGLSAAASARVPSIDPSALDVLDVLQQGSSLPDAEFARLCSVALEARARSELAYRLYCDAEDAANAAEPQFPPALISRGTYRPRHGEPETIEQRWAPEEGHWGLWNLAHAEAKRRGVPYSLALEAELSAQYDEWRRGVDDAHAAYLVRELDEAQNAAGVASQLALDWVHDYPARSADVLMVKLYLRLADSDPPQDGETFATIVADVARVVAA